MAFLHIRLYFLRSSFLYSYKKHIEHKKTEHNTEYKNQVFQVSEPSLRHVFSDRLKRNEHSNIKFQQEVF